ncbi:hypothetical protein [Flavobacterium sp. UBA6135]|uniref:hypothetical protein n=1 Tax=Flavobacterium sp. UBA6135 TaxID=1946553 RepID=UPI0025C4844C|nr:hypothetical protein [Flavobacterium sp. UBA6135]
MKKVILSLVLVAAMSVSFVSCKEKENEVVEEEVTEEVAPEVIEEALPVVDSLEVEAPTAE